MHSLSLQRVREEIRSDSVPNDIRKVIVTTRVDLRARQRRCEEAWFDLFVRGKCLMTLPSRGGQDTSTIKDAAARGAPSLTSSLTYSPTCRVDGADHGERQRVVKTHSTIWLRRWRMAWLHCDLFECKYFVIHSINHALCIKSPRLHVHSKFLGMVSKVIRSIW